MTPADIVRELQARVRAYQRRRAERYTVDDFLKDRRDEPVREHPPRGRVIRTLRSIRTFTPLPPRS